MRIAILSDVHANLPALEATLADVDAQDPDVVLCLGDLVGYAPWPNEVVAAVRGRRIPTIAGNYDEGVGLASDDCGCAYRSPEERERGRQSIAYTNAVVTPATRAFLHSLPRHLILELGPREPRLRVMLVHGSPRRVNEYLFEDRPDRSFRRLLDDARADVLVCGHTHRPFWKRLREPGDPGPRHVVNAGSVGKPKDGDPRACWTLLELATPAGVAGPTGDDVSVRFRRVAYDVERAARAIEESPLPAAFADALRSAV